MKQLEYKKKIVENLVNLIANYPIIGIVNMQNLPAKQLQKIRAQLRDRIVLTMTKKTLIRLALKEAEKIKYNIQKLESYLNGMPALLFTEDNPFKLYKVLKENKSKAPAKPGQLAPQDIIIKSGPTPFAPGPIISELSSIGLKAGVEQGKVVIKGDCVVVKAGEEISPKVAEILTRLGIEPMEIGLELVVVYEDGTLYTKDILDIDEEEFNNKVKRAIIEAFNLALFLNYPTKDTIKLLLTNAHRDAKLLGTSQKLLDKEIIEELIKEAHTNLLKLQRVANIKIEEKPKLEPKKSDTQETEKKVAELVKRTKQAMKEKIDARKLVEELKKEPKKPEEEKDKIKEEHKAVEELTKKLIQENIKK